MRKIILEEHWDHPINREIAEEYFKRTKLRAFTYGGFHDDRKLKQVTAGIEEYRLKDMDAAGIDIQILSNGYPGIQGVRGAEEAVTKSKMINDALTEITHKHPTRFKGFATLPLQDPGAAADELERAVKELGFVGALINGHTNGEFLDEDKFRCVWERSIELGVPLYLHAFDPIPDQSHNLYKGYETLLGPPWSWNIDTATHAMRIIASGLFEELPDAKLILGHMGEFIPYMLARIDEGYMQTGGAKTWKIPREPSYYYRKNVYITTSGLWNPETLVCAVSALTAEHVLFSVDYPLADLDYGIEQVERTPISQEDKEKIYHKNAEKMFNI